MLAERAQAQRDSEQAEQAAVGTIAFDQNSVAAVDQQAGGRRLAESASRVVVHVVGNDPYRDSWESSMMIPRLLPKVSLPVRFSASPCVSLIWPTRSPSR